MDMNAAFAKAKEARDVDKKLASNKGFFNFEEVQYLGLDGKNPKVFRIMGSPVEVRDKSSDAKLLLTSMQILADDKKSYARIIWPNVKNSRGKIIPDPSWILSRLYNKVMEGKWTPYTQADVDKNGVSIKGEKILNKRGHNGQYVKFHTQTSCYDRIQNAVKVNEKFPDGINFYPKPRVVFNVLDRSDDWCVKNKHTKVIASKVGSMLIDGGAIRYFPSPGIPASSSPDSGNYVGIYDKIFDHYVSHIGNWSNVDTVLWIDDMTYMFRDGTDINSMTDDIKQLCDVNPLTEEEKSYELYDLDKYFPSASYSKLYNKFVGLFKLFDAEFNENLSDELEELVIKEKEKKNEAKESEESEELKEKSEEKKPEVKLAQSSRRQNSVPDSAPDVGTEDKFKILFPFWKKLTEAEQNSLIVGLDYFDGDTPVWTKESDAIECKNKECVFVGSNVRSSFSAAVFTCPVCGMVDKED